MALLGDLTRAQGLLKGALAVDPELVRAKDAATMVDAFVELERLAAAGKTLFASRAAESKVWQEEGHKSAASWMAETSGSGFGESAAVLETSERLRSLPETTEALRRGELSGPQVKEIASAAALSPSSEKSLLRAAHSHGLKGLKDEARRVKARAISEAEATARYEQIRKQRSLVMWIDHNGVGRLEGRFTPDALGRLKASLQRETNAVFAEARQAGHRESTEAYAADALVALVTGTSATGASNVGRGQSNGKTAAPATMLHLRVDAAALRRGKLGDGEVCEVPGVGPVPLATATNAIGSAILQVIVTDGVDVACVANMKRAIPARLRRALENRDETCVVPGCDVAKGLENDHYKIAFMNDGPTELWNLCRLCRWHHYLKTHCGYAITGGPGSWEWMAPTSETNPVLTA